MSARPTPALSVAAPADDTAGKGNGEVGIGWALGAGPCRGGRGPRLSRRRIVECGDGSMLRVVDGMNVIGTRPDGWWRDRPRAQRRLVGELGALGEALTVVFDGRDHEVGAPPGVEVRFAPHADDAIAELAGPDVVVVTSDRGLAERVRARGGTVESSKAFADRLRS